MNNQNENNNKEIKFTGDPVAFDGVEAKRDPKTGKGRFDLIPTEIYRPLFAMAARNWLIDCNPASIMTSIADELFLKAIIQMTVYSYLDTAKIEGGIVSTTAFWRSVWPMLQDLAIHFQKGAEHYGERNCEKGIPLWSFKDSAMRHAAQLFAGKKDEPHAISVIWNCWMAQWTVLHEQQQTDTNNESHMIVNTLKVRTPEEIETARIRSMSVDEVIAKVIDILITKRREIKAEQYKYHSDISEYKELNEKQKRLKNIINNLYSACSEIATCSFGTGILKDVHVLNAQIGGNDNDELSAIAKELKSVAEQYNAPIITARQGSHNFTDEELEMFITTRIETFLADKHNLERIFMSIDTKDLSDELFRRLDAARNKT